ncbi:MAG: alpha-methylacyl-CoA racemase [Chloroflexota bacterium]|jgi:crotonobetainyl-CoA:carnitine CoA-transferase CaiB-like acyl-CoA transferase|nr:alpha-methylacyl-CoA racemase [Chloroflexota bacterium]
MHVDEAKHRSRIALMDGADDTLPLDGVRVLSLALNVPGPVAARRLAQLGAAVSKIEPPAGDPLAQYCPEWYAELHLGLSVRTLDLRSDADIARLHGELGETDLLLTSHRTRSLARVGLDWIALHRRHPRLCHVAIVGHSGDDADVAGHDLTYLANVGLLTPPDVPRTLVADLGGAERAVVEATVALLARERTGEATYREVSLGAVAESFAAPLRYGVTAPAGILGGTLPAYGLYRAMDGWIALAALEPRFSARLAETFSLPALERPALEAIFSARSVNEWEDWARERDIPLAAVR